MSHPLSRLIFENPSFSAKEIDTIITTYLKGRAKWLKEKWVEQGNWHKAYTYDHIDTAFELSEKCECEDPCSGKKIGKPKPSLPSKREVFVVEFPDNKDFEELVYKIINCLNTSTTSVKCLTDYLHSKEAQ